MNEDLKINASECELIPMGLPNENTSSCFKVGLYIRKTIRNTKDILLIILSELWINLVSFDMSLSIYSNWTNEEMSAK